MRPLPLFALFGCLTSAASGAYVQYQLCDGDGLDQSTLPVDFFHAKIARADDRSQRLSWDLGLLVGSGEECNNLAQNVTASLAFSTLFGTDHHKTEGQYKCIELPSPMLGNTHELQASLKQDIQQLYPLATFHSEIRLGFAYNSTTICTEANITPALDHTADSLFRWLPTGIMIVVLIVGILRSCFDKPIRLPSSDLDEADITRQDRPVLPHVGDCLQYLQFIFFTGALSLRYPGFYQPAVSNLNWFSLLLQGPVTHGFVYQGVVDGIYEINGTYGGTYGLEIMHQIVGAPNTMATWLNMAISVGIIAIAAAFVLEGVQLLFPRTREDESDLRSQSSSFFHLRFRLSRVLRVVLSYFSLPLVTISFYQFDNAAYLPGYHTSLATLLVVCIIAAFAWLLYQVPVRSLGMLVFDSKRYQHLTTLSTKDRYGKLFVVILFVLSFIKGVAMGGLQISPAAQLAILGSVEIVLLVSISGFQAYPMRSVGTVSSLLRLVTVGLMITFLPSLDASLRSKSLVGYVILAIHAFMLLFGFFLPAMYHLCLLVVRNLAAPKPEVYGLRALQRRGASSSADVLRFSDAMHSPSPSSNYASPRLSGSSQGCSPDPRQTEFPPVPNYFFRPPRPTSGLSLKSEDMPTKKGRPSTSTRTTTSTSTSGRSVARDRSPRSKPRVNLGAIIEPRSDSNSLSRSSESASGESVSAGSPTTSNISSSDSQGRPLGPRWHDYSFREADLYYMAGQASQQMSDGEVMEEEPQGRGNNWQTIRKVSSGLWSKVANVASSPAPEERGFHVVRPNRPPPGVQMPPQTSQVQPQGEHAFPNGARLQP